MLIALALTCPGCPDEQDDDSAGDDDIEEPTAAPCDTGFVHDPDLPADVLDDFPDGCIPEACGIGPWGQLNIEAPAIFVDVHAAPGGDGSAEAPFGDLRSGLGATDDDRTRVLIAAGVYPDSLLLTPINDGAELTGRCPELVRMDATGADGDGYGIWANGSSGHEWWITGITIADAPAEGLRLDGGTLHVTSVELAGNGAIGAATHGSPSQLFLDDVYIHDTRPNAQGQFGRGFSAEGGAYLEAHDCRVEGNTELGVYASQSGTRMVLQDVVVTGTLPSPQGTYGRGLHAQEGAVVEATDCTVEGNADVGVLSTGDGTNVQLTNVEVRSTAPNHAGDWARGIAVQDGAILGADGLLIVDNADTGIIVTSESYAYLANVEVRETHPTSEGDSGIGIMVEEEASLEADGCLVVDNTAFGVLIRGEQTSVSLSDVEVRTTRPTPEDEWGWGIAVISEAHLEVLDGVVEDNRGIGIAAEGEGTTLSLTGVTIRETQPDTDGRRGEGLQAQLGAFVQAQDTVVEHNAEVGIAVLSTGTEVHLSRVEVRETRSYDDGSGGNGILVGDGATILAEDCVIDGNNGVGFLAASEGTLAQLTRVEVTRTDRGTDATLAVGVAGQMDAILTATDLVVEETEGVGLYASTDASVSCTGCDLLDNTFAGAVAWYGAALSLSDVHVVGTTPDSNEGGGVGVYASSHGEDLQPTSLTVEGSTIEEQPYAAAWLEGDGDYAFRDNTLVAGYGQVVDLFDGSSVTLHGDGIVATGGIQGLVLENNVIQDAYRAGVLLDGSSATLTGNTVANNDTDLVWQDCDGVVEPVVLGETLVYDNRCASSTLMVNSLDFALFLEEADIVE